jgi:hypothetical protein
MASPSEKLAQSLELLHKLQTQNIIAIQGSDLTRTHRERLLKNGFIKEVIRGWFIPSMPDEMPGDSTPWFASYWHFCAEYLNVRFGREWCLSPEQSLLLHAGNWSVPQQLLVKTSKGDNKITALPHDTSFFNVRYPIPPLKHREQKNGLWIYKISPALAASSQNFFTQHPTDIRTILSMQTEASELLEILLEGEHTTIAGRLAGAFRNIGNSKIAEDILKTMKSADFDARETDPFEKQIALTFNLRERSPYVNRMQVSWIDMREKIIEIFPPFTKKQINIDTCLEQIEANYVSDAYHSLSIEGYRVSRELIERVRSGKWSPNDSENDRNHRDALAARGYWQAFQAVKNSILSILKNGAPGKITEQDHGIWYRELFGPSVTAGILRPADLAGYRTAPVYIRQSMHVPPNTSAVRDMIPPFFELLQTEQDPRVRIILSHFFFGYIHPYMDGNGRMSRFLMNTMLTTAGYPWTIVPVEKRATYMQCLEEASVKQNIAPFSEFIVSLIFQ